RAASQQQDYGQWAAREGRLGALAPLLGLPARQIPGLVATPAPYLPPMPDYLQPTGGAAPAAGGPMTTLPGSTAPSGPLPSGGPVNPNAAAWGTALTGAAGLASKLMPDVNPVRPGTASTPAGGAPVTAQPPTDRAGIVQWVTQQLGQYGIQPSARG